MEKRYLAYGVIIIICIISLGIGIHDQIYGKENKPSFGSSSKTIKQTEETERLKEKFMDLFTNTLTFQTANITENATRKDRTKDYIYTSNQLKESVSGRYEININIPELNIVSEVADRINTDIDEIFVKIARNILTSDTRNYTIYNIDYVGFVNSNIVSLVIKATLKEGNTPQRVMIKTYNYNLDTGELAKISDILKLKNIEASNLQKVINEEIKQISRNVEEFNKEGYSFFERNLEDTMYKVEKTEYYFLGEGSHLYIIYPYGNTANTSEVDVIVV